MPIHPRAGTPALAGDLVDVASLTDAYHRSPDPSAPEQRVAFGTSGHRGSSLRDGFNEAHILAITQALCDHRAAQGVTGPLFLGLDPHALSGPAGVTALEVFAANDVTVLIDERDGYTPTPRCPTPSCPTIAAAHATGPTVSSSPRRTIRRPTAGSSTTRRTAARPAPP